MLIYSVLNKVNGKLYVGKTTCRLSQRKSGHKQAANSGGMMAIYCAIRKYGWFEFEWNVLCYADDEELLNELEVVYIKELKSKAPDGYNLTEGGEGETGYKWSEELGQRMRKPKPKGFGDRISRVKKGKAPNRPGYKHSTETKEKIRRALKGHAVSKQTRQKMSVAKLGKSRSKKAIEV